LAAQERILGPDQPDTVETKMDLASLLQAKGDLPEAEGLYH
jgi:hypothetical protein